MEAERYAPRVAMFDTPGGHHIWMHYRDGTNDWNTLTSSLTNDEYELPSGMSGRAVDVGGYLGSVGIALALDNPDLDVTIIEPVPDNADLIERNIDENGLADRITLIRGAVGDGIVHYGFTGDEAAEHHAFVGNSTLATPEQATGTVTYPPIGLMDLLPVDYLKIDCEGGEWVFLRTDAVAEVPLIVGEAHAGGFYVGSDIIKLLKDTHDVTLIGGSPDGTCGFRAVLR